MVDAQGNNALRLSHTPRVTHWEVPGAFPKVLRKGLACWRPQCTPRAGRGPSPQRWNLVGFSEGLSLPELRLPSPGQMWGAAMLSVSVSLWA